MLARTRIGTKIVGTYAATVGLLVALLVLAVVSLRILSGASATFVQVRVPALSAVAEIDQSLTDVSRAIHALSNGRFDVDYRTSLHAEAGKAMERLDGATAAFDALERSEEATTAWSELATALDEWSTTVQKVQDLERTRDGLLASGLEPSDPRVERAQQRILNALVLHRDAYDTANARLDEVQAAVKAQVAADGQRAAAAASRCAGSATDAHCTLTSTAR